MVLNIMPHRPGFQILITIYYLPSGGKMFLRRSRNPWRVTLAVVLDSGGERQVGVHRAKGRIVLPICKVGDDQAHDRADRDILPMI
jgi:hypothetical protein